MINISCIYTVIIWNMRPNFNGRQITHCWVVVINMLNKRSNKQANEIRYLNFSDEISKMLW